MGPIPHHMHQSAKLARRVGQEGKPESYYFPPQHNNVGNNFPYTFFGLEPGTTKAHILVANGFLVAGRRNRHVLEFGFGRSVARVPGCGVAEKQDGLPLCCPVLQAKSSRRGVHSRKWRFEDSG
jgi:hypothetical protein